jgi:ABC-type transport system involved in multi-copper enzyme maturation permease subunit
VATILDQSSGDKCSMLDSCSLIAWHNLEYCIVTPLACRLLCAKISPSPQACRSRDDAGRDRINSALFSASLRSASANRYSLSSAAVIPAVLVLSTLHRSICAPFIAESTNSAYCLLVMPVILSSVTRNSSNASSASVRALIFGSSRWPAS